MRIKLTNPKLALYIVQIAKILHFVPHAYNSLLMAIFNFLISQPSHAHLL